MAATFEVYFDFGGTDNNPGTAQSTDALGPPCVRFKTADDATIDTVNRMVIPAGGNNYSFWKQIYLKCTGAPVTQVDNVKFYTDGSAFGAGIVLWIADEMPTHNSGATTGYDVATGTVGTTGDRMDSGAAKHTDITARTNAFSYTSGAAKTISISEAGNIINAQNETTNYIVLQMDVDNSAAAGDLANETLTWQYDEI